MKEFSKSITTWCQQHSVIGDTTWIKYYHKSSQSNIFHCDFFFFLIKAFICFYNIKVITYNQQSDHTKEKKMNFKSHLFITDLLLLYLTPKTENHLIDPFFKQCIFFPSPSCKKYLMSLILCPSICEDEPSCHKRLHLG